MKSLSCVSVDKEVRHLKKICYRRSGKSRSKGGFFVITCERNHVTELSLL